MPLKGGSDASTFFDDLCIFDLDKKQWIGVSLKRVHQKLNHEAERDMGKGKEKEDAEKEEEEEGREKQVLWPCPRRDHAMIVHRDTLYLFGGKGKVTISKDDICLSYSLSRTSLNSGSGSLLLRLFLTQLFFFILQRIYQL